MGNYLQNKTETFLRKLLRMFHPREIKLVFGNSYWRICRAVLELEGKRFSLDELEKTVNQDSTFGKEQVSKGEVSFVLEKLKENGFLGEDAEGFKLVSPEALAELNEFFGFNPKPGTGKIGFAKYLAKSQKRVMMWFCLHEPHAFIIEESARITGYSQKKCYEFLERFSRKKWLGKVGAHKYSVIDEKAILGELLSGYMASCSAAVSMRDFINVVLQRYEKVSGKMIHEDLEEEGIECDPKTVYNHMKTLEKEAVLKRARTTGERRKSPGPNEKFYAVNLEYSQEYNKDLIARIEKRMKRSGLLVSDKFYQYARKKKPAELTNFMQNLRWGLVLRSPDQTSSVPLWLKLLEELHPKVLSPMLSEMSHVPPKNPDEKLKTISNKHKVSPFVTSLLYYSLCKFRARLDT
jgi:DNA-binding Lrp family transcriptional regulator